MLLARACGLRLIPDEPLLNLGEVILIERRIHHLIQPVNLRAILGKGEKDGKFVGPLLVWQRCVGLRGCMNSRGAPGCIMNNFLDIQLLECK